jgi:hypothetical protein
MDLSGTSTADVDDVSALSRIAGVALGLFGAGGFGTMIEGATMGVGQAARGVGVNIAVACGLMTLGFTLPVVAGTLVAIGGWRSLTGAKKISEGLKEAVAKEIKGRLREQQPTMERELCGQLSGKMAEIRQSVDERLTVLVDEVRGQLQGVIREREQQERTTEQMNEELKETREELLTQAAVVRDIRAELDACAA